ncbi:MAG: amidase [Alphaproteobacteria bacterium]|nr:amidase [Alphaproteobacteria bacterium]
MADNVTYTSALALKGALERKEISPVEIVRASLDRLAATEPKLNSFVTVTAELALDAARAAEDRIMKKEKRGLLDGLPISVKDVIPVKGVKLTTGSRAMAENIAAIDAPVVERIKAAGACIVGKTTASEFGCKAVGDSPLTGITRNPWNTAKTSGGSSAGAVSSVAAGVTPFAVATDGGGSIRIPCSLTGLFGIKAQFGRVPMYPVSAAPSLAHTGALARTVRDAALLLMVEAGYDSRDPFSVAEKTPDFLKACDQGAKGLRVAWSATLGYAKPDPEVVAIAERAAQAFAEFGCTVEHVEKVFDQDPVDLFSSEFYAGIGTRLKPVLEKSRHLLDPAVVEILSQALNQTLEQYYVNVFRRYELREKTRLFFENYDILLSPTLPVAAFDVGKNLPPFLDGLDRNVVSWVYYTYPFNLTGQPAASIPAGFTAQKLPVGLQMVARINSEVDIFRAAAAFEEARPWADYRPPLA